MMQTVRRKEETQCGVEWTVTANDEDERSSLPQEKRWEKKCSVRCKHIMIGNDF